MRKVYLQKVTQYGTDCFIGKIDPRILVKIATKIEMSETQEAQRPLNEKRVKDIAKYVSDVNGILPNTLTLAIRNSKIKIEKCKEFPELMVAYFPDNEKEYKEYEESIDVMDGQHRLYSFRDDIRLISDNDKYEIGFTLYDNPSLWQRRKIFISCNEKQEKVSPNLLLWFKEKLDMLTDDEKKYFGIVSQLANDYPLKGHVIQSAEKIKNGVKAKEIIADLKHVKIGEMSTVHGVLDDNKIVNVIEIYLRAWQNVAGFDFATSTTKEAGVAVKMAGLKYMIYLLPAIWDYSINCHEKFNEEFVEKTLRKMIGKFGIEADQFFVNKELNKNFRDRTMIMNFSDQCIDIIKKLGSEDFDPLA